MKKLSLLAVICSATLFVSACVGLMTAGPAAASSMADRDVRVINTQTEAVPTRVMTLPAVQVSSLPAVQVGSMPPVTVGNTDANRVPVQVDSLPPVRVANPTHNPVPVEVMNPGLSSNDWRPYSDGIQAT